MTHHHRKEMSETLRADMHSPNYEEITMVKFIFIDLPPEDKHQGHIMGDVSRDFLAILPMF